MFLWIVIPVQVHHPIYHPSRLTTHFFGGDHPLARGEYVFSEFAGIGWPAFCPFDTNVS